MTAGSGDRRPGHDLWLLLVAQPLAAEVVLAVQPGEVVVEERDGGVGVVLDPLERGAEVRDEGGGSDLGGGAEVLAEEVVRLLEPEVDGAHRLVGEGADAEFFAGAVVDLEELQGKEEVL